ncbi:MAG: OmpH family outer membrane protein [Prevotella sp.]
MKKYILSILVACSALAVQAQDVETTLSMAVVQKNDAVVGYFSKNVVLQMLPEYSVAERQLSELREKYEAEIQRAKEEFNSKYEEFLDGQKDFPPTIMKKRQTELEDLMNKNIAFKEESRRLLAEAERTIFAPIHERIAAALAVIGEQQNLVLIVNTDSDACPYLNPLRSVNVTDSLLNILGLPKAN